MEETSQRIERSEVESVSARDECRGVGSGDESDGGPKEKGSKDASASCRT